MITYEELLDRDLNRALLEGSMHFEEKSAVHQTLRKIVKRLEEFGIPYAIVGGMALFFHGYRRFTDDVDILVTSDGLKQLHQQLEGLGYVPPFAGSRQLRDTETGVRIEFLVTGQFPGDGKPKPIAFPDPVDVRVNLDAAQVVDLPRLIELKLASGMAPGRLKDLGDIQELIRQLYLPQDYAEQLDPYVRDLFRELWSQVDQSPPRPT